MIIKSMSRKGGAHHFQQLYNYISKDAEGDRIWHNFLYHEPDQQQTVRSFSDNARHLKTSKRHNILYHEIISLKRSEKDQQDRQMEALRDLARQYLASRAKGQLAYGAIHLDTVHSVHLHLMISSNDRGSHKRVRLPKYEFLQIQKTLESNLQRTYPELEEKAIYNKPWEQSQDLSNKEQNLKSRTKAPSKKEQLRETMERVFKNAPSQQDAKEYLETIGIDLVARGNNITAVQGKLKCRLKTLKLDEAYQTIGKKLASHEKKEDDRMDDLYRFWRENPDRGVDRER